jgi:hypothetical protein
MADKVKTDAAKNAKTGAGQEHIDHIEKNKEHYQNLLTMHHHLAQAKNTLVKHLEGQASKRNLNIELCRNWHWMWSLFYYNKKHYGFLYAFKITLGKFISSFFKFFFYLFLFRFNKSKIYLCRLLGLLSSYLNLPSSYRPKI